MVRLHTETWGNERLEICERFIQAGKKVFLEFIVVQGYCRLTKKAPWPGPKYLAKIPIIPKIGT